MEKKHYIIIIVVLVVLNIFSWRIWWAPPVHKPSDFNEVEKRGLERKGGTAFFVEKLNLDEEQKREFEKLRKLYFDDIGIYKDSLNTIRMEMISNLNREKDFSVHEKKMMQMGSYKLRMEKLTLDHFKNLRNVCNEEQRLVYDTLILNMVKRHPIFGKEGRSRGKHRKEKRRQ